MAKTHIVMKQHLKSSSAKRTNKIDRSSREVTLTNCLAIVYKVRVKPTCLVFCITFAAILMVQAQANSPAQIASPPANQLPPASSQTNAVRQPEPADLIQSRLKNLQMEAPVTYRTNGNLLFCTISCRDLDQRNAVYDGFSNIPKYGLTATKNPPSVTVVLLLDAAKYLSDQRNQKLTAKLQSSATNLVGHVMEKTQDGLLVGLSDSEVVLVTEAPNLSDGDPIKVIAFRIGTYEVMDRSGARKVLRKYTCDLAAATDHWTPAAASEAKAETQKRTELSE